MNFVKQKKNYAAVTVDINNYCNAACKCCFSISEKNKENMEKEPFRKALEALPFLEGPFILGCFFEPSISSSYKDLIRELPVQYLDKTHLYTNLIEKLEKKDIENLAEAHIGFLEISLNFIDQQRLNEYQGVEENYIFENLVNIKKTFEENRNPPQLRFTTLILKDNINELGPIAEYVKTKFEGSQHIFLTPYYDINNRNNKEFIKNQLLAKEELDGAVSVLKTAGEHVGFWTDLDIATYENEREKEKLDKNKKTNYIRLPEEDSYTVQISSNGDCLFYGNQETINLQDMDSPFRVFSQKLTELQHHEAEQQKTEIPDYIKKFSYKVKSYVDNVVEYDNQFMNINGWVNVKEYFMEEINIYILVDDGTNQHMYKTDKVMRPDVADDLGMESAAGAGFKTIIEKRVEWFKKDLKTYFVFEDTAGNFYKKEANRSLGFLRK